MALILFAAVCALIFAPTLLAGRIVLIGDPLKQFYPIRTVAWEMIRSGHLPSWMPHILSGYPSMSMVMLGLGYPLTWGYLFLPGQWAEQVYELAPYFLAPLFTYAFLREWKRSRAAAVLGALTFGYGGFLFSPIGLTGVHANSALWLPLALLGVARSRRRPFFGPLMIATGAYTMSVLAGSGQIFLYAGALMLAYAIFLSIWPNVEDEDLEGVPRGGLRPLAVAAGAIALSVGLTAFQTFETWNAVSQSVREAYPANRVTEGSFPGIFALRSLLQPLGNYWDSSTFVPLVALILALVALFAVRRGRSHVYFWASIAVISWLLILGNNSPLFQLYVRVPFVKMFRYPSRHSMEWTFAIGVLAAYGWDSLGRRVEARTAKGEDRRAGIAIGAAILATAAAAFIAWQWLRYTQRVHLDDIPDLNRVITHLDGRYIAWKVGFTICIGLAIAIFASLRTGTTRETLLIVAVALSCLAEPYVWMVGPVVEKWSPSRQLFGTLGDATKIVQKRLAPGQRTLSLPHPYTSLDQPVRDFDPVNWTALAGFEDANGYESLILSRYSRAFEGTVDAEPFVRPDATLLGLDSHLLDLLAIGYVVAFRNYSPVQPEVVEKYGIAFSPLDLAADVRRDHPLTIWASGNEGDALGVVTTLGNSGFVNQGAPVARITVHSADGRVVERDLLAGVHTSEIAFDRPDVKSGIRHRRAAIFDSTPAGAGQNFDYHRYFAKIDLGERMRVSRVDFLKTAADPDAGVGVWKVSVFDSATKQSLPLPQPPPERWQTIYERNDIVILRNLRPLPRAWLVGRVGTLDDAELLRLVRGESEIKFDPRTTAFVDTAAGRQTLDAAEAFARNAVDRPLSGGVRILRHDQNRIVYDVTASQQAMLVASEIFYPGWAATIDGREIPIHRTDYLLRGVFVPAGHHTVEMEYRAPGARKGALVSLATLAVIGVMVGRARRKPRRHPRR